MTRPTHANTTTELPTFKDVQRALDVVEGRDVNVLVGAATGLGHVVTMTGTLEREGQGFTVGAAAISLLESTFEAAALDDYGDDPRLGGWSLRIKTAGLEVTVTGRAAGPR